MCFWNMIENMGFHVVVFYVIFLYVWKSLENTKWRHVESCNNKLPKLHFLIPFWNGGLIVKTCICSHVVCEKWCLTQILSKKYCFFCIFCNFWKNRPKYFQKWVKTPFCFAKFSNYVSKFYKFIKQFVIFSTSNIAFSQKSLQKIWLFKTPFQHMTRSQKYYKRHHFGGVAKRVELYFFKNTT